jgi:hypothetical protein
MGRWAAPPAAANVPSAITAIFNLKCHGPSQFALAPSRGKTNLGRLGMVKEEGLVSIATVWICTPARIRRATSRSEIQQWIQGGN